MEHFKSRNNDYFHFTNPHDDVSEFNDDGDDDDVYDESQYYDVDDDDDDRSCDFNFYTYRPLGNNRPSLANSQTIDVMNQFDNGALIFQLDNSMKNISDKIQHTIEGIGTQISRVEDETWKLDNFVQEMKNSEERYHRMTHCKLMQMRSILQEVQDGVLFLRDKHEIAETQLQLAILRGSVRNQINIASQSSCNTSFVNQQSNEPALSQAVSYYPVVPQAHELTAQQYALHPSQQSHTYPLKKSDLQFPHFVQSQLSDMSFFQISNPGNYKSTFHDMSILQPVESFRHSQEESTIGTRNYNPTYIAETLHCALPTAIRVKEELRSEENRNTTSVGDVIDKVTGMGFRRDHVTACVTKLALNESQVDLNSVLDKMRKNN